MPKRPNIKTLQMQDTIDRLVAQRKRVGEAAKRLIDAGQTTGKMGDDIAIPVAVWLDFAAAVSDLPEILRPLRADACRSTGQRVR